MSTEIFVIVDFSMISKCLLILVRKLSQIHYTHLCNYILAIYRALGFKQAMPIQVPKSPVPPFPEKSSRMYKQHNDI